MRNKRKERKVWTRKELADRLSSIEFEDGPIETIRLGEVAGMTSDGKMLMRPLPNPVRTRAGKSK